jgi:hypothetical protein
MVPFPKASKAFGGSGVFGKKTQEYSDLVVMFADGTINPTTKPWSFYNDLKYKSTYNKFSLRSFTGH